MSLAERLVDLAIFWSTLVAFLWVVTVGTQEEESARAIWEDDREPSNQHHH